MGQLGVVAGNGGASLVFISQPLCDLKEGTACGKDAKPGDVRGYAIRTSPSGEAVNVSTDEVQALIPNEVFKLAFGEKPENNAVLGAASLLAEVEGALADMNKREKFALEALERYQNSPTVNAETAQPDPGGE